MGDECQYVYLIDYFLCDLGLLLFELLLFAGGEEDVEFAVTEDVVE